MIMTVGSHVFGALPLLYEMSAQRMRYANCEKSEPSFFPRLTNRRGFAIINAEFHSKKCASEVL